MSAKYVIVLIFLGAVGLAVIVMWIVNNRHKKSELQRIKRIMSIVNHSNGSDQTEKYRNEVIGLCVRYGITSSEFGYDDFDEVYWAFDASKERYDLYVKSPEIASLVGLKKATPA